MEYIAVSWYKEVIYRYTQNVYVYPVGIKLGQLTSDNYATKGQKSIFDM